jgi:hypothetical protein
MLCVRRPNWRPPHLDKSDTCYAPGRARLRGLDVEMLTPPTGKGAPQGQKTPEARIARGVESGSLEAKSAVVAPDRGTWNAHADDANAQLKASGRPGEISFDWTEVDIRAGGDFKSRTEIENFLRGKMTTERLRSVRRFEIVWKDASGHTWVTSRVRAADGTLGNVITELL